MGGATTTELVFVEIDAEDEAAASRRVEEAATAQGLTGWTAGGRFPDPFRPKRFGVELMAPDGTSSEAGWEAAHALAAHLSADVEAVVRGDIPFSDVALDRGDEGEPTRGGGGEEASQAGWHLDEIGAEAAWAYARGAGILIGHPDTGATAHPELGGDRVCLDLGFNFLEEGPPIDPLEKPGEPGHGTATASLMVSPAGGETLAAGTVSGLAPEAQVVPIRVTNTVVVFGWQGRLARAIEHAVSSGCHVISLSLGGLPGSRLARAVRAAHKAGTIVIAAAGNHVGMVVWPAAYDDVIAVAATGPGRKAWKASSRGPAVDISAPGEAVHVARWKSKGEPTVEPRSGTSFSTALVASAAALWLSHHGVDALFAKYSAEAVPDVFRTLLRQTASKDLQTRPFPPAWFGAGLLDCKALLEAPLPAAAPKGESEPSSEAAREASPLSALSDAIERQLEAVPELSGLREALRGAGGPSLPEPVAARVRALLTNLGLGAPAEAKGLRSGLATELHQRLIVEPKFREALLRELITPPLLPRRGALPEQVSTRLREALQRPR